MRCVAWSVALVVISVSVAARAERQIESLPHSEDFDADTEYQDLIWTTQGCEHTWSSEGYEGGAAKFTPPLQDQGACGLGQFILQGLPQIPEQLNLRFLIYHGSTWREFGPGNKLVIMNREGNDGRPMIITREFDDWETWGACDGTVCKYEEGDFWPLGGDRLRIGDPPNAREEEWISVEFEANTETGMIRLYVDTLDGELSDLYVERYMDDTGPGGTWSYIDLVGGYMEGAAQADPNNYFMIDALVIDSERIGPPVGFGAVRDGGVPTGEPGGASDSGANDSEASDLEASDLEGNDAGTDRDAATQSEPSSSADATDAQVANGSGADGGTTVAADASIPETDTVSNSDASEPSDEDDGTSTPEIAPDAASNTTDPNTDETNTNETNTDDIDAAVRDAGASANADDGLSNDLGCSCTVGRPSAPEGSSWGAHGLVFAALAALSFVRRRGPSPRV